MAARQEDRVLGVLHARDTLLGLPVVEADEHRVGALVHVAEEHGHLADALQPLLLVVRPVPELPDEQRPAHLRALRHLEVQRAVALLGLEVPSSRPLLATSGAPRGVSCTTITSTVTATTIWRLFTAMCAGAGAATTVSALTSA